ncbi:biotin carboxylase [Sphingomonas montana]|uniref:ATP-binding protein n=1 Tax=Sphingomonas montana TaxID=1843236 RepID=UPI00096FC69E|nr:biotin carboxylase [Sphingomonas montana]
MKPAPVAILYQALPPPLIGGLRKDAKPGGYSDGGADIAFALREAGVDVVMPTVSPDPATALDWVFPDTAEGIRRAGAAGASVLWANTILFEGHPLEAALADFDIVGQLPAATQAFDDKFETNRLLAEADLPVARSFLLSGKARENVCALADVEQACATRGMSFPMIVKPVRGRGSQGVTLVETFAALRDTAAALIAAATFGDMLMVEEFLGGDEMTVTVMPPAAPRPDGSRAGTHWALRPVYRFDQRGGVAPYNGDVPVTANSVAIGGERLRDPAIVAMIEGCVVAAGLVGARTAIRIDCRADQDGWFKLFDLNMKPNMTGPGRPGRNDQDCLSAIAARADGWSYVDLLQAMLAAKWWLASASSI